MSRWPKVRLGDVCSINPPKDKTIALDDIVSFIPMINVSEDGKIIVDNPMKYSEVSSGYTHFIEDDVLFAKITPCMENGKGAIARGLISGKGVGSTEFHVLRPNKDKVTSDWVYRITASRRFRNIAEKNMTGSAGQKRVPKKFLENVLISLPDIDEQSRYGYILDKVELVLDLNKQQLTELDNLIKSTFYEMFGDPVANEKGWRLVKLTDITSKIGSGATPRGGKASYKKEGISFIRSMNVHNGKFIYDELAYIGESQAKQLDNVIVQENDVLINITGASVARSCVVPTDILPARVNQHVAIVRLRPSKADSQYISNTFISPSYRQKLLSIGGASGATREALTKQKLEELDIPLPPLSLQNQFAEIVTKIEEQKALVKQAINETQLLFDSLMSQYFDDLK